MAKFSGYIPRHFLIICPKCQRPIRTPIEIHEGMLPVKLRCPKCGEPTVTITDVTKSLPKVAPPKEEDFWIVEGSEQIDSETANQIEEANRLLAFEDRADEVRKVLYQGLEKIAIMQTDIENFKRAFFEHFSTEAERLKTFGVSWHPHYIKEFILNPFTVIPIGCQHSLSQSFSRLILSPKFFTPNIGIKLSSAGGFRVELINQYTRLAYPMFDNLCEYLGVPKNLDLYVRGNKILGSSLPHCWKDIPGTTEDYDHTEDSPSIRIIEQKEETLTAKQWLVRHGVPAWPAKPIDENIMKLKDAYPILEERNDFKSIWRFFRTNGRVCLFTANVMHGRQLLTDIAYCIKGTKVIFVANQGIQDTWRAVNKPPVEYQSTNEFIFYGTEAAFSVDLLDGIRMIIVDCTGQLPVGLVQDLYMYKGIVAILCDDPLQDFATNDINAPLLHGLAGLELYDNSLVQLQVDSWPRTIIHDSPIINSLRILKGQKPASLSSQEVYGVN